MLLDTKALDNNNLKDYIATLAHDLKNPLLAQIRTLELISSEKFGKITPETKEMIDLVLESSFFMKNLLFSSLDNFKKENLNNSLNKTVFDLSDLIKRCINELSSLTADKNLVIVCNFKADRKEIFACESEIRRAITNILTNALTYAFSNTKIQVNVLGGVDKVRVEFITISPKIPDSLKDEIFKSYVGSNIGLGLHSAKKIIESHFGSIGLECFGNQNNFYFELPL